MYFYPINPVWLSGLTGAQRGSREWPLPGFTGMAGIFPYDFIPRSEKLKKTVLKFEVRN